MKRRKEDVIDAYDASCTNREAEEVAIDDDEDDVDSESNADGASMHGVSPVHLTWEL